MSEAKKPEPFGVVIACCDRDRHLASATIESITQLRPDLPICLIYDGIAPLKRLRSAYPGLRIKRRENTSNRFLRENSYGYGVTKMVALWESPFETFLYLDSDACAWGDLSEIINLKGADLKIPSMPYSFTMEEVNSYFFNTSFLASLDPEFTPEKHTSHYFCSGTFVARRGIFSLERYAELLRLSKADTKRFSFGEQGILNYMIFSALERSEINVVFEDFQYLIPDHPYTASKEKFSAEQRLQGPAKPWIIHYAGLKPYVFHPSVYSEPFYFYRFSAQKRINNSRSGLRSWLVVSLEDFHIYGRRVVSRWGKKLRSSLPRLGSRA